MIRSPLRAIGTRLALCVLLASGAVGADERRSLEELMSGFGADLDNVNVTVETIKPGLHVMRGAGGAVLVSIGDDGVLMVDDQFPQSIPGFTRAIAELGGEGVDFVINTHWHFDHADGNPVLGEAGARIIAHSASREQMTRETKVSYGGFHYLQPPYPAAGLPVLTFDDSMSVHFNGQRIDLLHYGPAHTAGDAAVFFRGDNAMHVGDIYNARYPYIDAPNGGSLAGLIAVCRSILDVTDADTLIVSGHARVAGRRELENYFAMLEMTHQRLEDMLAEGKTLDEILAANPTAEFDEQRGNPTLFIMMSVQSMTTD